MAGQRQARRHAHHAHAWGQSQCQHGVGGFQSRLGEGVAQEIGVLVPELLVQHIDHGALGRGFTRRHALLHMRVQSLGQQDGRARVAAQMRFQRHIAEALGIVMFEQRGVIDHGVDAAKALHHTRHQRAYRFLVKEVSIKRGAIARQLCARSYGLHSLIAGVAVVHSHLPARAGQGQGHVTSKATGGTGHQYCAWSGG